MMNDPASEIARTIVTRIFFIRVLLERELSLQGITYYVFQT